MNYKELAERLREAESSRVQIGRLTDEFPEMTVADAYQIQLENVAYRQAPAPQSPFGSPSSSQFPSDRLKGRNS